MHHHLTYGISSVLCYATSSYPYILDCLHRLNWIGLSGHRCFSFFFLYFFLFLLTCGDYADHTQLFSVHVILLYDRIASCSLSSSLRSVSPDLKLICFTNSLLRSLAGFIWTAIHGLYHRSYHTYWTGCHET